MEVELNLCTCQHEQSNQFFIFLIILSFCVPSSSYMEMNWVRSFAAQNSLFDVPRFPKATLRSSDLFRHLWPKRPLRRSEISETKPRSSGLFRRVLKPKNDLIVRETESNRVRLKPWTTQIHTPLQTRRPNGSKLSAHLKVATKPRASSLQAN